MYVKFDTSLKDNIIMIVKVVKGNISYGSCSFIISAGYIWKTIFLLHVKSFYDSVC